MKLITKITNNLFIFSDENFHDLHNEDDLIPSLSLFPQIIFKKKSSSEFEVIWENILNDEVSAKKNFRDEFNLKLEESYTKDINIVF